MITNNKDKFTVFVKPGCPFCKKALSNMTKNKVDFTKVVCKDRDDLKKKINQNKLRVPSITTFPRIFKGTKLIGGSDDLEKLLR
jgi:glutaredoxin-related protein